MEPLNLEFKVEVFTDQMDFMWRQRDTKQMHNTNRNWEKVVLFADDPYFEELYELTTKTSIPDETLVHLARFPIRLQDMGFAAKYPTLDSVPLKEFTDWLKEEYKLGQEQT